MKHRGKGKDDAVEAVAAALREHRAKLHASIVETLIIEMRLLEAIEELMVRKGDETTESLAATRSAIAEMMAGGSALVGTPTDPPNPSPQTTMNSSSKRSEKDSSSWREEVRKKE